MNRTLKRLTAAVCACMTILNAADLQLLPKGFLKAYAEETQAPRTSISDKVVYCVLPNSKFVRKDNITDPELLKGQGKTLTFMAARNEREAGQIVLNSPTDLKSITIEKQPLTDGKGHTIPEEYMKMYFENYVYEDSTSLWRLSDTRGTFPDALLEYDLACKLSLNKLTTAILTHELDSTGKATDNIITVNTGTNQGIWFTLDVPKEIPIAETSAEDNTTDDSQKTKETEITPAGDYTAKYTITCTDMSDQTTTLNVPVSVHIYNFAVPDQTNHKTYYASPGKSVSSIRDNMTGMTGGETEYWNKLTDFLNDRKISTSNPKVSKTWAKFSKVNQWGNQSAGSDEDLSDYADGIYDFVTSSECPYYEFPASYQVNPPMVSFDKFDFDIIQDYFNYIYQIPKYIEDLTVEELLKVISAEQLLEIIPKEDLLKHLSSEDLLNTLSAEELLAKIPEKDLHEIIPVEELRKIISDEDLQKTIPIEDPIQTIKAKIIEHFGKAWEEDSFIKVKDPITGEAKPLLDTELREAALDEALYFLYNGLRYLTGQLIPNADGTYQNLDPNAGGFPVYQHALNTLLYLQRNPKKIDELTDADINALKENLQDKTDEEFKALPEQEKNKCIAHDRYRWMTESEITAYQQR